MNRRRVGPLIDDRGEWTDRADRECWELERAQSEDCPRPPATSPAPRSRRRRKRCPAFGCKAAIPSDYAMCGEHWAQVPRDLQAAVYRAWTGRETPAFIKVLRLAQVAIARPAHYARAVRWRRAQQLKLL